MPRAGCGLWRRITLASPKSIVAGVTCNCPVALPVPDSWIVRVWLGASETIEMLPSTRPLLCGAKVTPNVKLSPAAKVKGKSSPFRPNSVPVEVAERTISGVAPLFVIVMRLSRVRPTATSPSCSFLATQVNCVRAVWKLGLPDWFSSRASPVGAKTEAKTRDTSIQYVVRGRNDIQRVCRFVSFGGRCR